MISRGLLAALLAVLTLASSAWAAGAAWVLWQGTSKDHGETVWEPNDSFEAKRSCDGAKDGLLAAARRVGDRLRQDTDSIVVTATGDSVITAYKDSTGAGRLTTMTYRCLPDTIDPRGPKTGR